MKGHGGVNVHPNDEADRHTGRPIIRTASDGGVLVLCPYGHLHTFIRRGQWAGAVWEANVSDPSYTETCWGTINRA
jgi:hypothetical protein